ncbi:MAG: hydroxyacylglutathione hydrolase, partial [Xanthomonadales bacterium]|nr:hydroxyacylglutathione hydrolase [Xanthomonadales bacterium]
QTGVCYHRMLEKQRDTALSQVESDGTSVEAIPTFSDNYIWLLRGEETICAVVDPGEAGPVFRKLEDDGLELAYILLTHHHYDHIGGAAALLEAFPDAVAFAPADPRIDFETTPVGDGGTASLARMALQFEVIEVPAHTRSHIAFHGHGMLFCGDTLFSVGCGKLFEGTPAQMQDSLDKLAALPGDTRVYCGHEYTESNCRFALNVEPNNEALVAKSKRVQELRKSGRITLPGTLEEELAVNPFMRTREESVVSAARKREPAATPGAEVLGVIRAWKDAF